MFFSGEGVQRLTAAALPVRPGTVGSADVSARPPTHGTAPLLRLELQPDPSSTKVFAHGHSQQRPEPDRSENADSCCLRKIIEFQNKYSDSGCYLHPYTFTILAYIANKNNTTTFSLCYTSSGNGGAWSGGSWRVRVGLAALLS